LSATAIDCFGWAGCLLLLLIVLVELVVAAVVVDRFG
jgi:hypothetical protein